MQSDELKRRISAGRGDALADLVLKNSKTQTEYIRHHRCSAAESRSGCFLIGDNKNTAGECGIILEKTLYGKDKHDERSGYYETPCRLRQRL